MSPVRGLPGRAPRRTWRRAPRAAPRPVPRVAGTTGRRRQRGATTRASAAPAPCAPRAPGERAPRAGRSPRPRRRSSRGRRQAFAHERRRQARGAVGGERLLDRDEVVAGRHQQAARLRHLVGGADPVAGRGGVDEGDGAQARHAHVEVVILAGPRQEVLTEPADPLLPRASQHHRRGVQQVAHDDPGVDVADRARRRGELGRTRGPQLVEPAALREALGTEVAIGRVHAPQVALGDDATGVVDRAHVGPDEAGVGVPIEHRDLGLELPGQPRVVAVEERHELAAGFGEGPVTGRRHARVVLPHVAHPVVGESGKGRRGVVGGAVVDDDDLEPGPRLGERRSNGRDDERRTVVRGHDDAHERPGHVSPLLAIAAACPARDGTCRHPISRLRRRSTAGDRRPPVVPVFTVRPPRAACPSPPVRVAPAPTARS